MWAIMFTIHHGLISATNGLITKKKFLLKHAD